MSELELRQKQDVSAHKLQKVATAIHGSEIAEKIALRIKDAGALEKALISKLDAQKAFAQQFEGLFQHGGDRRSGEFQVASSDNLKREDWCKSFGFIYRTVQRWCELLQPEKYSEKKNAILKKCWELAELWQAASFSSESVEWYTPARYLEAVHDVLGGVDLDPASNMHANGFVRAEKYFTKESDGLKLDWFGRVFMNPPYGKAEDGKSSLAGIFCQRAVEQYECGNVKACIILVNSLHSQAWQAPLYSYPICFVDHRIQFISGDGEKNKNPTFQNIFVYLGSDLDKFAAVFSRFGYVMSRLDYSTKLAEAA